MVADWIADCVVDGVVLLLGSRTRRSVELRRCQGPLLGQPIDRRRVLRFAEMDFAVTTRSRRNVDALPARAPDWVDSCYSSGRQSNAGAHGQQ